MMRLLVTDMELFQTKQMSCPESEKSNGRDGRHFSRNVGKEPWKRWGKEPQRAGDYGVNVMNMSQGI